MEIACSRSLLNALYEFQFQREFSENPKYSINGGPFSWRDIQISLGLKLDINDIKHQIRSKSSKSPFYFPLFN